MVLKLTDAKAKTSSWMRHRDRPKKLQLEFVAHTSPPASQPEETLSPETSTLAKLAWQVYGPVPVPLPIHPAAFALFTAMASCKVTVAFHNCVDLPVQCADQEVEVDPSWTVHTLVNRIQGTPCYLVCTGGAALPVPGRQVSTPPLCARGASGHSQF